ncbi:carbohydrate ABC transporter permease [Pseudonocardia sp. DSM 110487]|uniref:carbohydrate ABC transporter permease n=1 Tax=Pseudonocardia sp. DSM 110487 TaxID=2865833 RepID=UPI001C6A671E|nr:carbohydrate ABC transporter permease [Pseudonocardia sp. DSM 110487]QYN34891.1 carbohydrate ABC transporter permease [Pseudonocardia sp. DSM 110487]
MNTNLDTALGLGASNRWWVKGINLIVCALVVLVFAGPLLAIIVGAFSDARDPSRLSLLPSGPTLENWTAALDRGVLLYLGNSLTVVGIGLLLQMAVSVLAAYALARKKFRGAGIVLLLILATMMLPEEILAIPLAVVLSDLPVLHLNLTDTLAGMIVPIVAWGFAIIVMTEFMKEVPRELEEAARIDGAGEFRIFWSVVLPTVTPALGVIGVFGFTMIWDQYLLPLLVASDAKTYTLPLALSSLRADPEVGMGIVLVAAALAMLPSIIAFLAFQRSFMRGISAGAIKG